MIKFKFNKTIKYSNFELNVDFELQKGDFLSIYGESGAGKTTILRIISGLENADKGIINSNDSIWYNSESKINIKPQERKIGFVFQNNSLFPNMTVIKNLEFALEKNQSKSIISELIETIDLTKLKDRKIDSLSGGQRQKVALARALVQKPSLLLLDEPFSAIDDYNRLKLQDYILKIHHKYNLTTILVTHNLPEIFKLSNKVLKIKNGKVEAFGSPTELFLTQENNSTFKLLGTILSLNKEEGEYLIYILVSGNIINRLVSEKEFNKYTVGELIELSSSNFQPVLRKNIIL